MAVVKADNTEKNYNYLNGGFKGLYTALDPHLIPADDYSTLFATLLYDQTWESYRRADILHQLLIQAGVHAHIRDGRLFCAALDVSTATARHAIVRSAPEVSFNEYALRLERLEAVAR